MPGPEDFVDAPKDSLRAKLERQRQGKSKYDAIPKAVAKDPVGTTELLLAGFGVPEVKTGVETAKTVVGTAEKAGGLANKLTRFGRADDPTTQAVQGAGVLKEGLNQAQEAGERKAQENMKKKKKLPGMASGVIANNMAGSGAMIAKGLRDSQSLVGMKVGGFITMKGPRRGSKGVGGKRMPKNGVMMAKDGVVVGGTKKTGTYKGKSNKLGHGGRAAQLRDQGVPEAVIGQIARRKQAAPGQKNYHGGK